MKTQILCSIIFFWKSSRLWDTVEKFGAARRATNDVTVWRTLDKPDYIHAHACTRPRVRAHSRTQIYNNYCFFAATVIRECTQCYVIRTLSVMLYLQYIQVLADGMVWLVYFKSSSNAMKVISFYTQRCLEYWDVNLWQACVMQMQIHE
jgi:hypothetical protein